MRSVILLAVVCLTPPASGNPTVVKRLDLKRLTDAGLSTNVAPVLVERGAALAVAAGMRGGSAVGHLVRLKDLKEYTVQAPLGAFLKRYPTILGGRAAWTLPNHRVEGLLFHDTADGVAGLLLTGGRGVRERLYAHWDLQRGRITNLIELSATRRRGSHTEVHPLGYSPKTRRFYSYELRYEKFARQPYSVSVFAVNRAGKGGRQGTVRTLRRIHSVHFDAPRERVLVVEYAEVPLKGPAPRGYIMRLDNGNQHSVELPLTTYGAAFSADGRTLFAYSTQKGTLSAIDVASGTSKQTLSVGTLGHSLGRMADGRLLLVRNAGLQLLETARLAKGRFAPMRRLVRGFVHTEGSLVFGRTAVVRNGDVLHFVRM